jgi:hypothetical protein
MKQSQFFEVSADWMNKVGRGDSKQAFEVLRVESNEGQPEYDVIVLATPGGEWPVFRIRGHMVRPYTLFVSQGHFEPCCVAADMPAGSVAFSFHQFDTKQEAKAAADELNAALKLVVADETQTAAIETVRKGSTVRRLLRNGLPMLKEWTVDAYDKASDKYALIDGKGGVYWIKRGTLVAVG